MDEVDVDVDDVEGGEVKVSYIEVSESKPRSVGKR